MTGTVLVLSLVILNVLGSPANEGASLLSAASSGDLQELKTLLDRGADIDAYDKHGDTALHLAARNNHPHVVKELLDRGANMEAQNNDGWTANDLARTEKHIDVVKEFFKERLERIFPGVEVNL